MASTSIAPDLRVGTADRERAATLLGEHFSAGRLDTDEFDQRVRAAYVARTSSELDALFTDLPGPRVGRQRPDRRPVRVERRVVLIALLILASVLWVALVRVPPFFLILVAWWFAGGRHRRRYRHVGYRWRSSAGYRRW